MKREDQIAESALIIQGIRELQSTHDRAHQALMNWAKWSRDRRGIYPPGVVPPAIWNDAPVSKWEHEEIPEKTERQVLQAPEKGDRPEEEEHDEKSAVILDERIHAPGGLPEYLRSVLNVAYITRYTPEDRFHKLVIPSCQPSTFRERLAEALRFVGRFV